MYLKYHFNSELEKKYLRTKYFIISISYFIHYW